MAERPDRFDITCPCCTTKLVIDAECGEILAEERPKVDVNKTFDDAVKKVEGGTQRREDAFSQAFKKTQNLDDVLNKKFEEAKKKAAADPSKKPFNPFDAD